MEMNDNTILRIKVPAHLYEAVKAQLTLKEAKQNFGTKDMKPVKGQKAAGAASDKPKAPKASKPAAPKKANAPQKETGAHVDKETEKMGAGMTEKKELGLDELKSLAELLNGHIAKLEEKTHAKAEKAPVEEEKEKMEEAREYDEFERDEEWSDELQSWVPVGSNRHTKLYKPKSHTGTATMTAQQAADATKSSFTKFDPTKEMGENINEEDYDKLSDMKRAGIYSKEEIANYLGLDLEKDRERIDYWYRKLGSTTPSYAGNRGRSLRRRW